MDLTLNFELSKEDNLLKRFEEIHNYIYANDGLSTQQTLEEIIKILFIKIVDENNKSNQFKISSDELNHLKQSSSAPNFVKRISSLLEETKKEFKDIFDADEKIRLSNIALGFTVNKLQAISLSDSSSDAKGLAFQKFLAHQEKDGRGQFFTPEPVVDFCVNIIQPKPDETIIDPACGSGGFLISSLKYILKNNPKVKSEHFVASNLLAHFPTRTRRRIPAAGASGDGGVSMAAGSRVRLVLQAHPDGAAIRCAAGRSDVGDGRDLDPPPSASGRGGARAAGGGPAHEQGRFRRLATRLRPRGGAPHGEVRRPLRKPGRLAGRARHSSSRGSARKLPDSCVR